MRDKDRVSPTLTVVMAMVLASAVATVGCGEDAQGVAGAPIPGVDTGDDAGGASTQDTTTAISDSNVTVSDTMTGRADTAGASSSDSLNDAAPAADVSADAAVDTPQDVADGTTDTIAPLDANADIGTEPVDAAATDAGQPPVDTHGTDVNAVADVTTDTTQLDVTPPPLDAQQNDVSTPPNDVLSEDIADALEDATGEAADANAPQADTHPTDSGNSVDTAANTDTGNDVGAITDTATTDTTAADTNTNNGPPLGLPTRWRSAMYPLSWKPSDNDAQGRFVHDFSYAGYHSGELAIPLAPKGPTVDVTKAPYKADSSGKVDATAAIQKALDDVGAKGGGVVFMPAGTYRLVPPTGKSAALFIRHSGVVLRGAGRGLTFLFNDATSMRNRSVISAGPAGNSSWYGSGGTLRKLAKDADNRSVQLQLTSASGLKAGDWIVAHADATDAWVAQHNMKGLWTDKMVQGPTFLRQITKVSAKTVTIDIPLRYPLLTRDDARVYKAKTHLHEIGMEDFAIGMRQHPGTTGWGDNDYNTKGKSSYETHGADLIRFRYVIDGWAQRVQTYRPKVNTKLVHMLSDGIVVAHSRNITVRDCVISHPQYEGGGGNGYSFVLQGSDNLIEDCAAVSARHAVSFKKMTATGNVIWRTSSSNPRLATDFHMHLSMSNLLDNMVLAGDYIDATYRPYGTNHGYTTTQSVLWATKGLACKKGVDFVVDSRQYKWGLAIATAGACPRIRTTPLVDTKDTGPVDWSEGVGAAATLTPPSLYIDQLYRRLHNGKAPPTPKAALVKLSAAADTYVRDGKYATKSYGADKKLAVKDSGTSYNRRALLHFDLSKLNHPIGQASLRVRSRVTDKGGDKARISVVAVADDGWSEKSATWNNKPSIGAHLASCVVTSKEDWCTLDVTNWARAQQDGDGKMSLALVQTYADKGLLVQVSSRESGATGPYLEIVARTAKPLPITAVTGDAAASQTSLKGTYDGKLTTRWSHDGLDATITWDLGKPRPLSSMAIAFYGGANRISFFEIWGSADGKSYTLLTATQSAGDTTSLQHLQLPQTKTRYVQFVGYGNSTSTWNSITEVAFFGP